MELAKDGWGEGIIAWACTSFICGVISIGGFRIFLRCCFVYFSKYLWIYIYPGVNTCTCSVSDCWKWMVLNQESGMI